MKKKTEWRCTEIPIYFGKLWVKFSDDFMKDAKLIDVDLKEGSEDHLAIAFRKSTSGPCEYVIMVGLGATADVIAHEALHVAHYIFDDRCVEPSFTNDEPLCYLLGWIITQVELAKS